VEGARRESPVDKVDFKKTLKHLYIPSAKEFTVVEVPELSFLMIDGQGDPGHAESYINAVAWLYAVSYPVKFASKNELGRDYTVPPLEGLWYADDISVFASGDRDAWKWTMMIMQPDWITSDVIAKGIEMASRKLGEPPESLRHEAFAEGLSVQILHIGPYADEAPTIARLHNEFLPQRDLVENGNHHEIYLGDPRRVAPEKLKTVLRQPVRPKKG
jgi:hypothetical protein